MGDPEEKSDSEIAEAERDAGQQLGKLEHEGDEMEERLEAVADQADDVNVPEPAEASEPGLDEADIPEDEGESASDAGQ